MKLFCAYAFTGEDISVVTERMRLVVDTLTAQGHDVYCNRFDTSIEALQKREDYKGIFRVAFTHLAESEAVVAIVSSANRSVGQIMEIGAALNLQKPLFVFEHSSAADSSYIPRLANRHYSWGTLAELASQLQKI